MSFSPLLQQLIEAFQCLPGVGPKSAQRMAFHLLERGRPRAKQLAESIQCAMTQIGHCQQCNNFSESELCHLCTHPKRDNQLLCVVESPADVVAVEQTSYFSGRYFVLMGHLSPLDGIGPKELHIDRLQALLSQQTINEVIIATNPTVEGEATAHYLAELCKSFNIKATRIAHGVPIGSALEFVDGGTLTRALASRDLM